MVYIFLADGFEEIEALTPYDVLKRANIEVKTVCVGKGLSVAGSHGIKVEADINMDDVDLRTLDMAVLPGGMPGAANLDGSKKLGDILEYTVKNSKYAAAICAAPMVLGKRGYLKGKKAVCYPGFEKYLDGAEICDTCVVRDGYFITAKGMGKALGFGLELVSALKDKETAEKIRNSVFG